MTLRRILLVGLVWVASGPAGLAEVINFQVSSFSGPVTFSSLFIPETDPNAHFSLPTLAITESVKTGVGLNGVVSWDLEVVVTREPPAVGLVQDEMVSIDKAVTNETGLRWDEFRITLGSGLGGAFVESNEVDLLFIKDDPSPTEEIPTFFQDPPEMDDAVRADNVIWSGPPGLPDNETAQFWIAINVPHELFINDSATFVLRETSAVPEPSSVAVWTLIIASVIGWQGLFQRNGRSNI